MAENGYPLPSNINAPRTKCILLCIPDDPAYIRAYWGQIHELARWWAWERDAEKRGTLAAQVALSVYEDARACWEMSNGACEFCCPETNFLLEEILLRLKDIEGGRGPSIAIDARAWYEKREWVYVTYISAPTTIHRHCPDISYVEKTGDPPEAVLWRERALCHAVDAFTHKVWTDYKNWLDGMEFAGAFIGAGITLIFGPVIAAIASLVGAAITNAIGEIIERSILENEDARCLVRECMYTALHDSNPATFMAFQYAMDSCGFEPLSPEWILARIVRDASQDATNWLLFLEMLGAGYELGMYGLIGTDRCECGLEDTLDFEFCCPDQQGWLSLSGSQFDPDPALTWVATAIADPRAEEDGYALMGAGENNIPGHRMGGYVELASDHTCHMIYLATCGAFPVGQLWYYLKLYDADGEELYSWHQAWVGGGTWKYVLLYPPGDIPGVRYIAYYTPENQWSHGIDHLLMDEGS